MNQIPDPKIANIVYNFLGNTLAQLNEIDKHNVGGSSLKALKTDPKNVFRINADAGLNLIPEIPHPASIPPENSPLDPVNIRNAPPAIPQATVVAAPDVNVVNAGINATSVPTGQQHFVFQMKNSTQMKTEIDKIISALSNIKNILDEPDHNIK